MHAAARAGVQRLHRVRCDVDRAVERHGQRRCEADDPAQPLLVDAAVLKQQPHYHPVRTGRLQRVQIRLDHGELGGRVPVRGLGAQILSLGRATGGLVGGFERG